MTEKQIMPFFVFVRRRDIEREMGFILAGRLVIDIPKRKTPNRRQQRLINESVQELIEAAVSGQWPDGAVVYGWPGGCKPTNAVDVNDDAVMAAWAKEHMVVELRVDSGHGGQIRFDNDILLQMGLLKRH
jgi:hypothetical protein